MCRRGRSRAGTRLAMTTTSVRIAPSTYQTLAWRSLFIRISGRRLCLANQVHARRRLEAQFRLVDSRVARAVGELQGAHLSEPTINHHFRPASPAAPQL